MSLADGRSDLGTHDSPNVITGGVNSVVEPAPGRTSNSRVTLPSPNSPNTKGLRLDYFVCSKSLMEAEEGKPRAHDSYTLPNTVTANCSDHCPVGLCIAL